MSRNTALALALAKLLRHVSPPIVTIGKQYTPERSAIEGLTPHARDDDHRLAESRVLDVG
jgi:hypothetical protein